MEKEEKLKFDGVGRSEAAWRISISLLGCVFFSYMFSVIPFYFGISISEYVFPMAALAGIVVGASVGDIRMKNRNTGWIAGVLLIIVGAVLISGFVYDHSFDGIRYHQEIVAALIEGWNPLQDAGSGPVPENLWSLHYAKAIEIAEASIGCFTGKIETGKGINLIMIAAAFFGVYAFLREEPVNILVRNTETASRWSRKKCLWVTIAIIINPVVVSQCLTFYIDFYKYLYLIMVLLGFYLIGSEKGYRRFVGYIVLGMTLVLSMGTKFNFFFEAGVWMVLSFIWVTIKGNFTALKRLFIVSLCALALGTLLAYHPYITNTIGWGHPVYPLMGENAVDIMVDNTPDIYNHYDRVTNFFISLISVSLPVYDQRMGGFTILIPLILLTSIVIGIRMWKNIRGVVWYAAVCVLLSCFIFEQTWWARYISQLWLFGALFLVVSLCAKSARLLERIISILMVLAGSFTMMVAIASSVAKGNYLRYLFDSCQEEKVTVCGDFPLQMQRHFKEERIKYTHLDSVPSLENKRALYYYVNCEPVIVMSDEQFKFIEEKLNLLHQPMSRYIYSPDK